MFQYYNFRSHRILDAQHFCLIKAVAWIHCGFSTYLTNILASSFKFLRLIFINLNAVKILHDWGSWVNGNRNHLPLNHYSAQVQFSFWFSREKEYDKSFIWQWESTMKRLFLGIHTRFPFFSVPFCNIGLHKMPLKARPPNLSPNLHLPTSPLPKKNYLTLFSREQLQRVKLNPPWQC